MKRLPIMILILWANQAFATRVLPKDLTNLVAEAEHILIARIDKVEMVAEDGKTIADLRAMTGPGIRLHLSVQTNGVLRSTLSPPRKLIAPLWKMWNYRLSQWKEREGETCIFLLKGEWH